MSNVPRVETRISGSRPMPMPMRVRGEVLNLYLLRCGCAGLWAGRIPNEVECDKHGGLQPVDNIANVRFASPATQPPGPAVHAEQTP